VEARALVIQRTEGGLRRPGKKSANGGHKNSDRRARYLLDRAVLAGQHGRNAVGVRLAAQPIAGCGLAGGPGQALA
jgi:hypothetical protein